MIITQHPPIEHFLLHISDTHFVGDNELLNGTVDSDANLRLLFEEFARTQARPEAIVITGDLADTGREDAYRRIRAIVEPAAAAIGAEVIWVIGNHDRRTPFRAELLDSDSGEQTVDLVHEINGLRIISLDTTVPGRHHGEITEAQYEWLADVLRTPAPHGTIIAMHHPPVPAFLQTFADIELRGQARFAEVVQGTDVRGILAGHQHYSTFSEIAGIPVSVASATCYSADLMVAPGSARGQDGAQSFNLVHLYEDKIMHSIIPIGNFATLWERSKDQLDTLRDRYAELDRAEQP